MADNDLIRRQDVIDFVNDCYENGDIIGRHDFDNNGLASNIEPVDAVEVVRCKDCANLSTFNHNPWCDVWDSFTKQDVFCSYSKKKEG